MRCLPISLGLVGLFLLFLLALYFAHLDTIQSVDKINERAGLNLNETDIIDLHSEKYHYVTFKVSKSRFEHYFEKVDEWCGCSEGREVCDGQPRQAGFYMKDNIVGQKVYYCSKGFHMYRFQEPYYINYSYYANSWID